MGSPRGSEISLDEFFAGHDDARALYATVRAALESIGEFEERVTVSQVAFRRRRGFAWVWRPGQYLRGSAAPLVLTIGLSRRDGSPRWKETVEPRPGIFVHHLELRAHDDIDAEVAARLAEAWHEAG